MRNLLPSLLVFLPLLSLGCSASGERNDNTPSGGSGGASGDTCGQCVDKTFTPCNAGGTPGTAKVCPGACIPNKGCAACIPDALQCVGNEVRRCSTDGTNNDKVVEVCDVLNGQACSNGKCTSACILAADQPSNVGCEFWAVDLDQFDLFNNPASMPWGVAISNAGQSKAHVVIESNTAPYGQPPVPQSVTLDGANTFLCSIAPVGLIEGKTYESRTCSLTAGAHKLSGEKPFGIVAYGYGNAGSYAFVGGADVKRVYEPPPLE